MPTFKDAETTVKRRFSDFLGLHERLNNKFLHLGRIVPPAPEKSVVGKYMYMYNCMGQKSGAFSVELSYYYLFKLKNNNYFTTENIICVLLAVCVLLRMLNNLKSVLHHSQKRSVL